MTRNILLVGVGGQGTILASRLLTIGLMEAGYDVKMSEIHGMSQRGGSVSSQVRYGEKVDAPVIEPGTADILVSFEELEALRWLSYLNPRGQIIVNRYRINPPAVSAGNALYPEGICEELAEKAATTVVDAGEEARKLGNVRVMNSILLGATIKRMELESINWEAIIRANVKSPLVDINLQALRRGLAL
ncbi:MAG: indolepyruvate oxidoreductase subunit beta [Spirochaetaceae bacterium]|nr:indolepyruvate oxidoreductase subunit beta [Spirochaetaceae bacterium]